MPQTLYDKIWNEHVVHQQDDSTTLLYVDRPYVHSKFFRKECGAL